MLLHGLEQRGLGLGRRAVDLVGEQDVREHRSAHEHHLPLSGFRIVLNDVGTGDVRRHQIGGELNAIELQVEDIGESLDDQGLGETGYTGDDAIAADQNRQQDLLEDLVLADDPLLDLAEHLIVPLSQPIRESDVFFGLQPSRYRLHRARLHRARLHRARLHRARLRGSYRCRVALLGRGLFRFRRRRVCGGLAIDLCFVQCSLPFS